MDYIKLIEVVNETDSMIESKLILKKPVSNHLNTFHAGVLFIFSEWIAKKIIKKIEKKENIDIFLKVGKVYYLKPAKGEIFIKLSVNDCESTSKNRYNIIVNICDSDNSVVTKTDLNFIVKEKK